MDISKSLRSIFAQLRSGCGMLPIRIETGLFKRDPLDARWAGSFIIHYVSYICNFLITYLTMDYLLTYFTFLHISTVTFCEIWHIIKLGQPRISK